MPKPSKEDQAIALLESSARDEKLSEDHLSRIASLFVLAGKTRPAMRGALSIAENTTPEGALSVAESVTAGNAIPNYARQYDRLPGKIKKRCHWRFVSARLLANGGEKLKKAEAMRGGGELFGIDAKGKALFKDRGVEPVMYGYDEKGETMEILDRERMHMPMVQRWANYFQIRNRVLKDGYELFTLDHFDRFGDEMRQVESYTKEPFVASNDRLARRSSWTEFGDRPEFVRFITFYPVDGRLHVSKVAPEDRGNDLGVVRLLRV